MLVEKVQKEVANLQAYKSQISDFVNLMVDEQKGFQRQVDCSYLKTELKKFEDVLCRDFTVTSYQLFLTSAMFGIISVLGQWGAWQIYRRFGTIKRPPKTALDKIKSKMTKKEYY